MSRCELSWQYAEQYPVEPESFIKARRLSLELGIEPIGRGIAAQLSALAHTSNARMILELGTGVGVSGLALLRYAPEALLTTVDIESELQIQARTIFAEAGIAKARLRLVAGDANQVLPRFNTGSYDLVLIDADANSMLHYLEQALPIVRIGGSIAIPHILNQGRVPDPAARDDLTVAIRDVLATVADSPAIVPVLSPIGDGLLTLTRLS